MKGKVTLGKKKFCPQNGQDFENFLDLKKILWGQNFFCSQITWNERKSDFYTIDVIASK